MRSLFCFMTLVAVLAQLQLGFTQPPGTIFGSWIVPGAEGSTVMVIGEKITLEWTRNVEGDTVSIALRRGDPTGEFSRIAIVAERIPNTGNFTWEVPRTLFPDIDYFLVMRTTSGFIPVVSETFRIVAAGLGSSVIPGVAPTARFRGPPAGFVPPFFTASPDAASPPTFTTTLVPVESSSSSESRDLLSNEARLTIIVVAMVSFVIIAVTISFLLYRRQSGKRFAESEKKSKSPQSSNSSASELHAHTVKPFPEKLRLDTIHSKYDTSPPTVSHELPAPLVELDSTPTETYKKRISEDSYRERTSEETYRKYSTEWRRSSHPLDKDEKI